MKKLLANKRRKTILIGGLIGALTFCTVPLLVGCAPDESTSSSGQKTSSDNSHEESENDSGEKSSSESPHSHSYGTTWKYDEDYHWHSCTECGKIADKSAHSFGDWIVDVQPTESNEGSEHRICNVCSYPETETLNKLEHVHRWGKPTYSWGSYYFSCVATRTCLDNNEHQETETAYATSETIKEAELWEPGLKRYTAKFTNPAFETQTKDVEIPETGTHVEKITLSKSSLKLVVGGTTERLNAKLEPLFPTNSNISWSISNPEVASLEVSSYDRFEAEISGLSKGTAVVTVTAEDGGLTATCDVTVDTVPVTGISLNKNSVVLEESANLTLRASISPWNASDTSVKWSSNSPTIASVDNSGVVKALKAGTAIITATTVDGNFVDTCTITVKEKENFSYSLGKTTIEIIDNQNTSNNKYINVFTPITNNGNVPIYVSNCTYDIKDESGKLEMNISSGSCAPNIVLPGETTYFQGIEKYTGTATTNLVATPHPAIKNAKSAKCIRYSIQNLSFVDDDTWSIKVIGEFVNNSSKEVSSLAGVAIQLFKKDGAYLTTLTCSSIGQSVPAGGSISFKATNFELSFWPDFTKEDIGKYECFAYDYELVI